MSTPDLTPESPVLSFPRSLRLLTPSQFKQVFDNNTIKVSTGPFLLLCAKNELDHPRLGLVIAKRRAKRAVDRNRIKRYARNSFRLRQHQFANMDMVLLMRGNLRPEERDQLASQLERLWEKLLAKTALA